MASSIAGPPLDRSSRRRSALPSRAPGWSAGTPAAARSSSISPPARSRSSDRIAAGSVFDGELAFYPSRQPLRALLKSRSESHVIGRDFEQGWDATIEAGLLRYAEALASNPWIFRWPLVLAEVRPVQDGAGWFLVDRQDHGLPVRPAFARSLQLWRLISARGGSPATVVVEWDGVSALPISAFSGSPAEYLDLAPRWAA